MDKASPSPKAARAQPPPADAVPASRIRILVVDDNVDAAQSLELLLVELGHEVQIAYDGTAAIATARTFRPQVVLLDIALPGMNGYDVARTLRSSGWLDGARIIALTGFGQDQDRHRSQAAGFDGHLVKPVAFESIARALSG